MAIRTRKERELSKGNGDLPSKKTDWICLVTTQDLRAQVQRGQASVKCARIVGP